LERIFLALHHRSSEMSFRLGCSAEVMVVMMTRVCVARTCSRVCILDCACRDVNMEDEVRSEEAYAGDLVLLLPLSGLYVWLPLWS
jgi:hypothetical protein